MAANFRLAILFLSFLFPFVMLGYLSYRYDESLKDISQTVATITNADPQFTRAWIVIAKYNFTVNNQSFKGIDDKSFYDKFSAYEFAKQNQSVIFYRKSNPDTNGFSWFLDLTWWIVGIVIFSLFSFVSVIPLVFVTVEICQCIVKCCKSQKVSKKPLTSSIKTMEPISTVMPIDITYTTELATLQRADDVAQKI